MSFSVKNMQDIKIVTAVMKLLIIVATHSCPIYPALDHSVSDIFVPATPKTLLDESGQEVAARCAKSKLEDSKHLCEVELTDFERYSREKSNFKKIIPVEAAEAQYTIERVLRVGNALGWWKNDHPDIDKHMGTRFLALFADDKQHYIMQTPWLKNYYGDNDWKMYLTAEELEILATIPVEQFNLPEDMSAALTSMIHALFDNPDVVIGYFLSQTDTGASSLAGIILPDDHTKEERLIKARDSLKKLQEEFLAGQKTHTTFTRSFWAGLAFTIGYGFLKFFSNSMSESFQNYAPVLSAACAFLGVCCAYYFVRSWFTLNHIPYFSNPRNPRHETCVKKPKSFTCKHTSGKENTYKFDNPVYRIQAAQMFTRIAQNRYLNTESAID